ncbi:hypothetical protein E1B28_010766 [Marasmius oreades]|uniref:Uncharacterized protein n=1 Tax=Marasmius oreades TaxID=181124 RepID=A0A9P7UQI5_9AGAR|nr:uncharacterized protein E1B28_010766 [Marasmius oreades]KAG7089056.1 hypothetical protein E1B28_010766 [Marasmius oreades]
MQRVDDDDSRIQYTPKRDWFRDGQPEEFMHTSHGSDTADAQMSFDFKGTKVNVYGTLTSLGSRKTSYLFSIDNGNPVEFFPPSPPQRDDVYNQQLFSSDTLQDGPHILTMKVTVDDSSLYFDYLEFMPSVPGQSSSPSPNPAPPSTTTSTTSETVITSSGDPHEPSSTTSPPATGPGTTSESRSSDGSSTPSSTTSGFVTVKPSSGVLSMHHAPTISTSSSETGGIPASVLEVPPSTSSSSGTPSSSHLSSGAVAGISIAVTIVLISGLGILVWRFLWKRRQQRSESGESGAESTTSFNRTFTHTSLPSTPDVSGTGLGTDDETMPKDPPPPYVDNR